MTPREGRLHGQCRGPTGTTSPPARQGSSSFSTPPNYEIPADSDRDNLYEVTMVASDSGGLQGTMDVTVAVTDVNEGPEISGQQSLSFNENRITEQVLASYTATDPEDPSAAITRWSLSGTDAGDFTIDESGQLSFRNVPDYERPADSNRNNEYLVIVRASDGRYYGYFDVTVTVEDVNEPPQITGAESVSYKENGTAVVATYGATDPEGSDISWSLSGTDSSALNISDMGALNFNSPPDYENPLDSGDDNVYRVTVEARDDQFNTTRVEVTVTVVNLTD